MSRVNSTRETWHPQTHEDRQLILAELRAILTSPHFCNSKRYPALLQYIVEHTLEGKADLLKERTLGVEVFDRSPTYDTNTDTVVRYTAGEVRKRLSLYYHEHGRHSTIRILLPAGSYIPEFLQWHEGADDAGALPRESVESGNGLALVEDLPASATLVDGIPGASLSSTRITIQHPARLAAGTFFALALLAIAGWRYRAAHPRSALEDFWLPAIRDQRVVPICSGGVVFAEGNRSGVTTAGKDIDYPFVSMQMASSIAQLSGMLARDGATAEVLSAPSTPLTEIKDHPVILLGGYNNQWTMRLLQPLSIHFSQQPNNTIVDQPQSSAKTDSKWMRDRALPYSSADDYAVIARFRSSTTGAWVVVLAGLGRNGTEAATQFATSPQYMQQLRERVGNSFGDRNIEAVLKVNVIDGKTGAPTILDVRAW